MHSIDEEAFKDSMRMDKTQFAEILEKIRPIIEKKDTKFRKAIPTDVRLMITLVFLGSGPSFSVLSNLFRVSAPSISILIPQVCGAIWTTLAPEELKMPETPEEWEEVAKEFQNTWQYPNCLGSIDGKHCTVQCPGNSSSTFHNYKGNFSIVLMAVADAHSRFLFVDIGAQGSAHDSTVFKVSSSYNDISISLSFLKLWCLFCLEFNFRTNDFRKKYPSSKKQFWRPLPFHC